MLEPRIIYEAKDFLALDKPAGLIVHAVKVRADRSVDERKKNEPTLSDWLVEHYPETREVGDDPSTRAGIVHRLDKETSGIMLAPRNQEYFEYLKSLFQKHEIRKTYLAVVRGVPSKKEGIVDAPIGIKSGTLKRSIHSTKMAKEAITEYRVIATSETPDVKGKMAPVALLEIYPRTGRTHQIRVHLASIGHPIVGDPLYGPKDPWPGLDRLMLHALGIEFSDRDGSRLAFEAKPPESFIRLFPAFRYR